MNPKTSIWLKGLIAAVLSGAFGGMATGLSILGIDPQHFNLGAGAGHMAKICLVSALINAGVGLFAYLKQSPLPNGGPL